MSKRRVQPAVGIVPPAPRTYRKHFTEEELARMVKIVRHDQRSRVLFAVMYDCGLRACEVGLLSLAHTVRLHESPPHLYVSRAKGSKSGWWKLSETTRTLLRAWIDFCYPDRSARWKEWPLFQADTRRYKGTKNCSVMNRHSIYRFIRGVALAAGVPSNVAHPHALRHARAMHLLEAADAESRKQGSVFPTETVMPILSAMLGHAAAKTALEHYVSSTRGAIALLVTVTANALDGLLDN